MITQRREGVSLNEAYCSIGNLYFQPRELETLVNDPHYQVEEYNHFVGCTFEKDGESLQQTILVKDGIPVLVSQFNSDNLYRAHEEDDSPEQRKFRTYLLQKDPLVDRIICERQIAA